MFTYKIKLLNRGINDCIAGERMRFTLFEEPRSMENSNEMQ